MKKEWIFLLVALALIFLLAAAIISTKKPEIIDELEVLESLKERQLPPLRESGEPFKELPRPFEREAPGEKAEVEMQKEGGFYISPKEAESPRPYPLPLGERQRARPPWEMKLPEPQLGEEEEFEAEKPKEWREPEEWEDPSLKELEKLFSEELEKLRSTPEEGVQEE